GRRETAPAARQPVDDGRAGADMAASFGQMGFGLIFAIVLVYLLLTVNFESWVDPLVILMAAPGALAGAVWMVYVTHPIGRPHGPPQSRSIVDRGYSGARPRTCVPRAACVDDALSAA